MTSDEARDLVIDGINYAAYREPDSSLHDSDKNRLFGSEHYRSGRPIYKPSAWEDDFEAKMATLLVWANVLNRSVHRLQRHSDFSKVRIRLSVASSGVPNIRKLRTHREDACCDDNPKSLITTGRNPVPAAVL